MILITSALHFDYVTVITNSSIGFQSDRYNDETLPNGGGEQQEPARPSSSASEGSTWRGLAVKLRKLLPYMWPRRSPTLQLRVVACVAILVAVRVANVFVPILSKSIVDQLRVEVFAWQLILLFVGLKTLQGGGTGSQGLLNGLRSFLWIRVQQFTTREIQVSSPTYTACKHF